MMKKLTALFLLLMLLFSMTACSSNSSYSSYSSRESSYDAKYGKGEFKKDLELYNSMKKAWPGN